MDQPNKPPRKGSFALMDPDQLRELARQGGRAVAAAGTGHRFTSEKAREAGKKGACRDLEHLRRIARLGGLAPKKNRAAFNAPSDDEDWPTTQEIGGDTP